MKFEQLPSVNRPTVNEDRYKYLKDSLLKGSLSLEQVRNKLIDLDQETFSRDASLANLYFLRDNEVVNFVNQNPEAVNGYNKLLSFTEFHVAQRLAINGDPNALAYFEEAAETARKVNGGEGWSSYVEGTILYVQGKEIPEDLIFKTEENNRQILMALNNGLKQRGKPLYSEDYGNFK
jgi:hypothetical protein